MKYIIVAGGVLSGLGKGITSASIGLLLSSKGIKTTLVKCDMYLNIDAGTMNPIEHGEVFVTHDGLETDQDLGHYERFLGKSLNRSNYMTNGQIYKDVLEKERALYYQGKCVEPYHHIPPEIVKRWEEAGRKNRAEVVIVELGGTVGEYEGLLFFEAARRIKLKKPKDLIFILVGYLPAPPSIGELKSKPLQQSISLLNSLGIQPDFIVARSEKAIDSKRKEKIFLASGVPTKHIIANPDLDCVYKLPPYLEKQNLSAMVAKSLDLKFKSKDLKSWNDYIKKSKKSKSKIKIGIVGKYQNTGDYVLEDSYVCVNEAIKHASTSLGVKSEIMWINAESLEEKSSDEIKKYLSQADSLIVPQGWGSRGSEGKIKAVKFARENAVPFLGLCFGMQMAVIEYARNTLKLKGANSVEIDPKTPHPVIHLIPDQKKYLEKNQFGGTIRLGAWPCILIEDTKLKNIYNMHSSASSPWHLPNPLQKNNQPLAINHQPLIHERHRHRYEFNMKYKNLFEKQGLTISGISPDNKLVEAIEIKNHPFFIGTQFHPEYLSRPLSPHPIFIEFIKASVRHQVARA